PTLGLALVGKISFTALFLICAASGFAAFLLSSQIRYKKIEKSPHRSTTLKFDIFEKTALQPALLLFFITATFGGISSFLPLHAAEKSFPVIESYFLIYALFLLVSRTFSGRIYDLKGHAFVFLPGVLFIFIAMLLLAWLPSTTVLLIAAGLYGLGFGSIQPALQAWAVEKAASNRKGMANATFFSFFDLGVGIGAMTFGQLAYMYGYASIYIAAAGSVFTAFILYMLLYVRARRI